MPFLKRLNSLVCLLLFFHLFYPRVSPLFHPPFLSFFLSFFVGIMSLFFCGITLSHYNTHNLSDTAYVCTLLSILYLYMCILSNGYFSQWLQMASEAIFKSLASFSEFIVFLYMGSISIYVYDVTIGYTQIDDLLFILFVLGMGVFTGGYGDWSIVFVFFTLIFCLLGRLCNTFPFRFFYQQHQIHI